MVERKVQHLDSEGLYDCVLRALGGPSPFHWAGAPLGRRIWRALLARLQESKW
jgi:hypothetical protein